MNPFDENPPLPKDSTPTPENPASLEKPAYVSEPLPTLSPGTPAAYPGMLPPPRPAGPEDLQISWSWPHFIIFFLFGMATFAMVQTVLAFHYLPKHQKFTPQQLQEYLISKPEFAIGSMLIGYAIIFFFLYITLAVLRGHPFWRSLGWRKIQPSVPALPSNPILYFFAGCTLSLLVAILTYSVKPPENIPMEELFKYRQTALLFVAMAVFVAPLVEETLFRGYLYPLFANSFGVAPGIVLTGVLFGLMHAQQLGWTWSLVSILILVGIVFTLIRARTGSVFASYMMHLGYNSFIAAVALLGTHGFTKLPSSR
jgi:membrane protease YdiL (CAAX protease family)